MPKPLEKELQTYAARRDELLATDEGKFVLILGGSVLGLFESEQDAIHQGYRQLGKPPFLVKQILTIEVPITFASRLLGL